MAGRDRPFVPGVRPTRLAVHLALATRPPLRVEALLDGEASALTRRATKAALSGDMIAMRLCMERILPARKDRHVSLNLPKIERPADAVAASAAILSEVAGGSLTPGEAEGISKLIEVFVKTLELTEFEERLAKLEEASARKG